MRTNLIVELALISMTVFSACRCGPGLLARPAEADWVVTPKALTLPAVYVGQRATADLTVDNLGGLSSTAPVSIDAPFTTPVTELTLGAGESRGLTLEAVPTFVGVASATLHLGALTVEVSVEGLAIPQCVAPRLCTAAHFDPERGRCELTNTPDDTACADACVTGQCRAGACEGTLNACDDGDRCTTDACGANGCIQTPLRCPAAGPCTAPTCDPLTGCATVEAPDGTLCGADDCRATAVDMAFDPIRQRVVLFGGTGSTVLGDAWEWDGVDWQPRSNVGAPSARSSAPMTWDSTGARLLLLGGPGNGAAIEAWSWNGAWADVTPATPSAAPPFVRTMAEDPVRHVVLGTESVSFNSMGTWEFSSAGWQQRTPTVSPTTSSFPMYGAAWDPVTGKVLISGVGQTWVFLP